MATDAILPLPPAFPHVVLGPEYGQWWRIHAAKHGPWWFSSCDFPPRAESAIGRCELPCPNGTCHIGSYLDASAAESLRERGVEATRAQESADKRRLSAMSLERWYGKKIADFTAVRVGDFGAPKDIANLPRSEARPWAIAAFDGGYSGILYHLREDPKRRLGLALFDRAGARSASANQGAPAPLPVGLRSELTLLFEGEYRGDPLPK